MRAPLDSGVVYFWPMCNKKKLTYSHELGSSQFLIFSEEKMSHKEKRPLHVLDNQRSFKKSCIPKLPCISYEQLRLFFPTVLAQLIWFYLGWTTEEIIIAMEELMSIHSWDSREDNVLTLVWCKEKTSTSQFEIQGFYSTEHRFGGAVNIPRRYQKDIIFSYYLSITIGEKDVYKIKSHVYFTHFPSFIMTIQSLWTTPNQKTLTRCWWDPSEPEVYMESLSTAPCKQKKFIIEVKLHYRYLKSSYKYFVFLVCSTVSDLFCISFASLFFEFDFQLEQDLQLFTFAKKKNLSLTAYQSTRRGNLHHEVKIVEIKQTKKTILAQFVKLPLSISHPTKITLKRCGERWKGILGGECSLICCDYAISFELFLHPLDLEALLEYQRKNDLRT